jgi:hypothetical protein
MHDLWRNRQEIAAVPDGIRVAPSYQHQSRFTHIKKTERWLATEQPAAGVCAGRWDCLLANVECRTMAVQPFSARFRPLLACPVRRPRPLRSPNELPAVEFSAAILAAFAPERRSRRTPKHATSQARALPFPSESSPPLGGVSRRITGWGSAFVTAAPNSAGREAYCGPGGFIADDANAIPSRGCNDAALLHRPGPPCRARVSKLVTILYLRPLVGN